MPSRVERGGRMHGAGRRQTAPGVRAPRRDAGEDVELERVRQRRAVRAARQLVDLVAAAPPAARRCRAEPWRRGRRAMPPVSTVTMLNSVSTALPVAAVPDALDRGTGEQALGVAEADGELEVVPGRAHRRADGHPIELDRHRFLDDQPIGTALGAVGRDLGDDQALGAATAHDARLRNAAAARARASRSMSRPSASAHVTRASTGSGYARTP